MKTLVSFAALCLSVQVYSQGTSIHKKEFETKLRSEKVAIGTNETQALEILIISVKVREKRKN